MKPLATTILLILALSLGLRAWNLDKAALDFDEVYEVTHARDSYAESYRRADDFPPLYPWAVRLLSEGFTIDTAGRWFSVLAGVAGVAAAGALGASLGGRPMAFWLALLTATSANHILYSQQFRAYGLYLALATLVMAAAWRLRETGSRTDWWLFGAASWLAMGVHYFSALLIGPLWLMVFVPAPKPEKRRALVAAVGFSLACLTWVPALKADLDQPPTTYTANDCDPEAWAYTYLTLVTGFTLGPATHELREVTAAQGVMAMAPWALAAAGPTLLLIALGVGKLRRPDRFWMLFLLFATPLIVAAIAAATSMGYVYRHFNWVLTPLLVLVAAGATRWRENRWAAVATGLFIAINLLAVTNRHLNPRYAVDDFHAVEEMLVAQDAERPVLTLPRYFGKAARYHLADSFDVQVTSAEPGEKQDWPETFPAFRRLLKDKQAYWLVVQHYPDDEPDHELIGWFLKELSAEHVARVSGTINVYQARSEDFRAACDKLETVGFTPPDWLP